MRRGRILIFVILIVIIGLIVAVVALRSFILQPSQPAAPANVDVYVAGQNIAQGGKITEDVLATKTLPQNLVTADMYTTNQKSDLLNNKIATIPLSQGTFITRGEISDASQAVTIPGPTWAAVIPPGMVAASIPTTRFSLAAYSVADGAHVNVNACFQFVDIDSGFQTILPNHTAVLTGTGAAQGALPVLSLAVNSSGDASTEGRVELEPSLQQPYYVVPAEPQRARTVCQTILQDVVVMKVGNFSQAASSQAAGQAQQSQQAAAPAAAPDIITLIVSPQDADMLDYMVYTSAQITLALRNPNDQSRQATNAITLQFALSQYNIPVPAKLPYGTQPRVDALVQPTLANDTAPAPAK
ncbi:MAG TPA: RcpC/CpaB family pilus assembly protein [Anaerolineales bacterium]|nr:RcpC/CpaB family pilus assembly protein [Anaerolineales bacterium]